MVTYRCNMVIEKVLTQNLAAFSGQSNSRQEIYVVSTFLPQYSSNPNGGLQEAVGIRLKNQKSWIIVLSFLDIDYLKSIDIYNILSLKGTIFIRLPFEYNQLLSIIEDCNNTPLTLSNKEQQAFIDNVCVTEVKKIFHSLNHGGMLDIGNKILNPLGIACQALLDFPSQNKAFEVIIENQFKDLADYLKLPEIQELLEWLKMAVNTSNQYLVTVQRFTVKLSQLCEKGTAPIILSLIEQINELYDKII